MTEYLIGGLIGAIIGYIVSITLDSFKKYIRDFFRAKRTHKQIGNLSKLKFVNDAGYLAIDHAIPMYKDENISLKNTESELIIEVPESYRERLKSLNFEIRESTFIGMEKKLEESFSFLNISDYQQIINQTALEVAQMFLQELQYGAIRFNGKLFGIENIRLNRLSIKEEASLTVIFYNTDYFTFRVFAEIYKKHQDKFNINSIQDLNKLTPFLSSFGLGNFLIVNDGKQDMVLLAHRSGNVIVDRNLLHYSMNEAFSLLDIDEYGNPSFTSCLFRGLKEELGIDEKYKSKITKYGFLDLGMDINRMEVGISSFARIKFDSFFTPPLLEELYSIAQDRELETKKLEFVPINDLDIYINDNKDKMSAGCKATLRSLLVRYRNGYITNED